MAITARASTATVTQQSTQTGSWTVTLPTYSVNDYVVIGIGNDVGSTVSMTTPTGWTLSCSVNESSGLHGKFISRKMDGTEGTTLTLAWTGGTGITGGVSMAMAYIGVDQTTPLDATPVGQAEASASAIAAHVTPSLTTVTANCWLVSLFVTDVSGTWTSTDTERGDSVSGGTIAVATAMYDSNAGVATGAYTRTGTCTTASAKATSHLMALRPAAVVAPTRLPLIVRGPEAVMRASVI